jgi:hypothetical protein
MSFGFIADAIGAEARADPAAECRQSLGEGLVCSTYPKVQVNLSV